jgi:5-methylcytosine-specific restriction endonuclease McrA
MPINWNRRKYTKEQFINAWNSSESISKVAQTLELSIYGSTYTTLKDAATELGLSRDHMSGQGHLRGKTHSWSPTKSDDEVFVIGKKENNHWLKKRLLNNFGWEFKCSSCRNTDWMGKPIAIELEHINGNNKDNRIENLTFLCPNCHAMTSTWRGRNKPKYPNG